MEGDPMEFQNDKEYTVQQIAAIFSVSKTSILNKITDRTISAQKRFGSWYVVGSELENLIERNYE